MGIVRATLPAPFGKTWGGPREAFEAAVPGRLLSALAHALAMRLMRVFRRGDKRSQGAGLDDDDDSEDVPARRSVNVLADELSHVDDAKGSTKRVSSDELFADLDKDGGRRVPD